MVCQQCLVTPILFVSRKCELLSNISLSLPTFDYSQFTQLILMHIRAKKIGTEKIGWILTLQDHHHLLTLLLLQNCTMEWRNICEYVESKMEILNDKKWIIYLGVPPDCLPNPPPPPNPPDFCPSLSWKFSWGDCLQNKIWVCAQKSTQMSNQFMHNRGDI